MSEVRVETGYNYEDSETLSGYVERILRSPPSDAERLEDVTTAVGCLLEVMVKNDLLELHEVEEIIGVYDNLRFHHE